MRLECCGHPLRQKNDRLSGRLARRKLADAAQAGAHLVCTACTYCQMQFEDLPGHAAEPDAPGPDMPSVPAPQLLGLALGLAPGDLGLDRDALAELLNP